MPDTQHFARTLLLVCTAVACAGCMSKPTASPAAPSPSKKLTAKSFPAKYDANFINDAYAHPDVWNGAAIATRARIGLIKPMAHDRALLELEVESPLTVIWAVWPVKWQEDFAYSGDTLQVLGWLNRTDEWNRSTDNSVPNDNPLTLLAICLVKEPNKEQLLDQKYLSYCDAWKDGQLPPDMRVNKK